MTEGMTEGFERHFDHGRSAFGPSLVGVWTGLVTRYGGWVARYGGSPLEVSKGEVCRLASRGMCCRRVESMRYTDDTGHFV